MARRGKWPKKWRFAMMPNEMLFNSKEWRDLSPAAKLIYLYLKAKFSPAINGKIRLYHTELKDIRGLKNPRTRCEAFKELESDGWIERTELGGLFRHFNEYKLTGKYDPSINWINVHYEKVFKR